MSTPLHEIDDRLRDATLRSRRRRKLRRDVESIEERVADLRARVERLRLAHEREVDDVDALTSASIRKFVAVVRGDLDERLSVEEAEAARAATELAHARDLLTDEEERRSAITQELDTLGEPDDELVDLRRRKAELVDGDSDLGRELASVGERAAGVRADLREVDEAIAAGERCLASIATAADLLRSAGNWSTWDVVGGGGLVTMAKHSRLDDARRAGSAAASALHRFSDELADVRQDVASAPSVDLDGWDVAFDFFFDNIFTDLRVDRMIRESQRETARVDREVRGRVRRLEQLRRTLAMEAEDLDERRRLLLDPPVW